MVCYWVCHGLPTLTHLSSTFCNRDEPAMGLQRFPGLMHRATAVIDRWVDIWWFPEMGVPLNLNHTFIFGFSHYTPSSYGGTPHVWKLPYSYIAYNSRIQNLNLTNHHWCRIVFFMMSLQTYILWTMVHNIKMNRHLQIVQSRHRPMVFPGVASAIRRREAASNIQHGRSRPAGEKSLGKLWWMNRTYPEWW